MIPITALGAWLTLFWIVYLLRLRRAALRIPALRERTLMPDGRSLPRVSVIVAAKDEERNLDACVRSILAQDYPEMKLVVVDDRSTDRTPQLLSDLRADHGDRLTVVTIDQVPDGWGGQNHALFQGVQASAGDWLCFTDADCRFDSRQTVSVAMQDGYARGLDVLSVLPTLKMRSKWEQLYLPLCSLVLLMRLRIADANDPDRKGIAYANGAFMLFRRSTYDALGGHARVRHLLNDDVGLALLAKQTGYRIGVASDDGLVSTRMYADIAAAWNGWIRNFSGTLRGRYRLFAALTATASLFLLPWVGFACAVSTYTAVGAFAAGLWGTNVALSHLAMWRVYRSYGLSPGWSLLYFPGALFVVAILGAAALRAWRARATLWHGVRYHTADGLQDSKYP